MTKICYLIQFNTLGREKFAAEDHVWSSVFVKCMKFIKQGKIHCKPSGTRVMLSAAIFDYYCHFESRCDFFRFIADEASLRAFSSTFRPSKFLV